MDNSSFSSLLTDVEFVVGVRVMVRKDRIGQKDGFGPIRLVWEKHKIPMGRRLNQVQLARRLNRVQYAHEVDLIGPVRIVHHNPDPDMRLGTADCDVNAISDGPSVYIEAADARIVR